MKNNLIDLLYDRNGFMIGWSGEKCMQLLLDIFYIKYDQTLLHRVSRVHITDHINLLVIIYKLD